MSLEFDVNLVSKHKISLLECQVELILRSLELYGHTFKYVCPKKKFEHEEEELRMSLLRDTYEQILSELGDSKFEIKLDKMSV